ncbi:MAG: hypothetical protein AB2809_09515, partial [Candidatus Thiodiazotropha sp.]
MAPGLKPGTKGAKSFKKWLSFLFKGYFLGLVKKLSGKGELLQMLWTPPSLNRHQSAIVEMRISTKTERAAP